jgi:glycosyltransferase involved in cell wall biosynthesis
VTADVLHVPYTYFPDAVGGTEVYVHALAQRLAARGYRSAVAAPGPTAERCVLDGIPVHRFVGDRRARLDLAYGVADRIAAAEFRAIVRERGPQIVHLHARTAAVSAALIDSARETGARVVFTYHTATASCARGTMMRFGEVPCDGAIRPGRCAACALHGRGVSRPAAALAGTMAAAFGTQLCASAARLPLPKAARIPLLLGSGRASFDAFMRRIDHVVAVCDWARDVLVRNGVPADKITVSRHGVAAPVVPASPRPRRKAGAPLRIAYFGRLDPAKGPDLLARALAAIPHVEACVDFYGLRQGNDSECCAAHLNERVGADSRLAFRPPVPPNAVPQTMAQYDLIAVPSRCLETGPLVVHEAFLAGVPVLGARLGGIAELVRDGVDGVLLAPDDVAAWAQAIERLAGGEPRLQAMRANCRALRTMDDAADDMAKLYTALLG